MAQTSLENFARRSATSLKRTNSTPGTTGREWLAVLGLVSGRHGAVGAAVEALFEREKLCADLPAFAAQQAGMSAGQLQRALPCFGAGVGEEDAVEAGALGEAQRKFRLALVINRGSRCG